MIEKGATALVSFGLAGGLDPALRPGKVLIASGVLSDGEILQTDPELSERFGGLTEHTILAGTRIVVEAVTKKKLFETTHASAVDLESGAVARTAQAHGLPFIVVRAICDPAERNLPQAALVAMDPEGQIGLLAVARSVLLNPGQIPDLLKLGRDAAHARRALIEIAKNFKPLAEHPTGTPAGAPAA